MKKPKQSGRTSVPKRQAGASGANCSKTAKEDLQDARNYVIFTDEISNKPEAATFDVEPGLGKKVTLDDQNIDISDTKLIAQFDQVCATLGCSRSELVGLLSNERYGSAVRLGLDRALEIDARTLSGRRPPRKADNLKDPSSQPSSEINRRDKRVVANIPELLTLKFAKVRESNGLRTLKEAFHNALSDWLEVGRPEPNPQDDLLAGGNALFQVRVELSTANALERAAKESGLTKRECVQAALAHYVR